ncbi:Re/Si-specific NAD(P)(+) transhydrogenase subunit alpha [Ornithinimicrobium pekingense]|uniref:proton-translocating NAD(P)(+) transhydrogenase n=1 Tax=Ornithinimicrobium pekingense TaxID=384677 RepID=A0ABQ2FCT7_9MICO|nr:Re/Si-specific NAD(P)(+) transhydrogenase subunit alpha [Ornithinimicrobium pekingense]GGK74947.1 NAD(P) transhydrogenase subunit alpha [Ornithinimicrobium pekingense]
MLIGIPKESAPGETRVAATPRTVGRLLALGHDVVVQAGAGERANFPDELYAGAGASVEPGTAAWRADLVVRVLPPDTEEVALLRPGAVLAAQLSPAHRPQLLESLAEQGVTALALDAVPRISRAQSLDVLSSMTNIGGYRAVVEAAYEYGSVFTGQVTAAGTVPPARVFVIGAGVAGLAAVGTAVSLGAVVRAFDVRPEVEEQVRSLGAEFVAVPLGDRTAGADGYARELDADLQARVLQVYARECVEADIVITTALVPGRPAPRLVSAETVARMRPGSVVVDMAARNGGNCELTQPGRVVTTHNGVRVVGYTDLPARLPTQASQLYGTNVANLVALLTPGQDGRLVLDLDDEVQRALTVTHQGRVTWPPPPVRVSAGTPAAPASTPDDAAAPTAGQAPPPAGPAAARSAPRRTAVATGLAVVLLGLLAGVSPPELVAHLTVFVLAVIVGFYVIRSVTSALHTPLLAETNAISGIILVGALLQVGSEDLLVRTLALAATVVASINVVGGFAVTGRMLRMFTRQDAA